MPAPSTPTFFASDFATPDGLRAPFSAACLLIKVVRIMLRSTGSVSSLANYLLSTDRALSNGTCAPSKIFDNIDRGAGRLEPAFTASTPAARADVRTGKRLD